MSVGENRFDYDEWDIFSAALNDGLIKKYRELKKISNNGIILICCDNFSALEHDFSRDVVGLTGVVEGHLARHTVSIFSVEETMLSNYYKGWKDMGVCHVEKVDPSDKKNNDKLWFSFWDESQIKSYINHCLSISDGSNGKVDVDNMAKNIEQFTMGYPKLTSDLIDDMFDNGDGDNNDNDNDDNGNYFNFFNNNNNSKNVSRISKMNYDKFCDEYSQWFEEWYKNEYEGK